MTFEELKSILDLVKKDPDLIKTVLDAVLSKMFEKADPKELINGAIDHFFEKLKEG